MLTEKRIKSAKARLSDYTMADGNGLYLRVRRSGAKTWITRRMIAGKVHVQTLGALEDLELLEARALAAGEALKTSAPEKRTVKELSNLYAEQLERDYKSPAPMVRYLTRDILPAMGNRRVKDIQADDIGELLRKKAKDGPVAANTLLVMIKGMFRLAVVRGWISNSPATPFSRKEAGGKLAPRQRELTDDEIRHIWGASTQFIGPIRLALLTGCRISECCEIRWGQVDYQRRRWTLPAGSTKQGREHWVPLTPEVQALLGKHPGGDGAIFPDATRINTSRAVLRAQRGGKNGEALPDGYTIHDARRTMATRLGQMGVNPLVIELMLGHALPKILATYNVADYEQDRVAAATKWSATLTKIVGVAR